MQHQQVHWPEPDDLGWLHLPPLAPGTSHVDASRHARAVYASVLRHLTSLRLARHPRDSAPTQALHDLLRPVPSQSSDKVRRLALTFAC